MRLEKDESTVNHVCISMLLLKIAISKMYSVAVRIISLFIDFDTFVKLCTVIHIVFT